jgi:hypothetical protein
MMKKSLSLVLALSMIVTAFPLNNIGVKAASTNLLKNPGFEEQKTGWNFHNANIAGNNPHSGAYAFALDPDINIGSRYVEQEVTVPYTGTYKTSAYIATGGADGTFGVRRADGGELANIILPAGATYNVPFELEPISLKQNDRVVVYSKSGSGWVNGDDFTFEYDPSSILENLMSQDQFNQMVRIPQAGNYILTATISGNGDVTITAGDSNTMVTATETPQEVSLVVTDLAADEELDISVTEGAVVTNYSLSFDTSEMENIAPEAQNVAISGNLWTGETLLGSYTFFDEDEGQTEGNSTYQWLASDTPDGEYMVIEGETNKTLYLTDALNGKYIKFAVTPKDSWKLEGEVAMSEPSNEFVKINYVRNASFDIEANRSPEGWKFTKGGAFINDKDRAKRGFLFGYIPANNPNADISYAFKVEKTAWYDLSMYINAAAKGTEIGVRYAGSTSAINSKQTEKGTQGYEKVTLEHVLLEKNSVVEVYAKGGSCTSEALIDDLQMFANSTTEIPDVANLFDFRGEMQQGNAVINYEEKTVSFKVPYGTDVTSLDVVMEASEGASISPSTNGVNFSNPVEFTISKGNVSNVWIVTCIEMEKKPFLKSSNLYLQDEFQWATDKTDIFVVTGQKGLINQSEYGTGTGPVDYNPSYWAGYFDRTAFYGRDFAHQAVGAQIVGLADENFHMIKTFAEGSTESRKWYTVWAHNFDGSPFTLDYHNDNDFIRELPAPFEIVQKVYEMYRWTGDERYIKDEELFNFCTRILTKFVDLHDTNGNGVAEGVQDGNLWLGQSTYNERGSVMPLEAGESIASQYQATLAYAGILKARGDLDESEKWVKKAADFKKYFNEEWSFQEGKDHFAWGVSDNGTKHFGISKESSFFLLMKELAEPGNRTKKEIELIEESLGSGIGSIDSAPNNIETYTYMPDTYFPYNKSDLAWKWMKYIIDRKDKPHERPIQGTNGDYPEISFTFISQVITGMMGIEPYAGEHFIITAPRLPSEVNDVEVLYLPVGDHEINVKHTGLKQTKVTNISSESITWEARFYGDFNKITVGEQKYNAEHKEVNGVKVSYATITVPANGTLEAVATSETEISHTITATAGENGTITPNGEVTVNEGDSTTFTFTPADGYVINQVLVDGEKVTISGNSYIFENVVGDHTIHASFKKSSTPTPDPTPDPTNPTKPTEPVKPTEPEAPKIDLSDIVDHWAKASIEKSVELGFVSGYEDGTFRPNGKVTRGEFSTMLARALKLDTAATEFGFADQDQTPVWAKPFIQALAKAGFISGYEDGTFRSDNKITRTELVVIIVRALGLELDPNETLPFDDANQVPVWAKPYVAAAAKAGIVKGYGDGKFNPNSSATRAEAVIMILAMLDQQVVN